MITRTHFADFLLSQTMYLPNKKPCRYLAKGKSAYVSTSWENLSWRLAGSPDLAVLRYWLNPLRYKTDSKLDETPTPASRMPAVRE